MRLESSIWCVTGSCHTIDTGATPEASETKARRKAGAVGLWKGTWLAGKRSTESWFQMEVLVPFSGFAQPSRMKIPLPKSPRPAEESSGKPAGTLLSSLPVALTVVATLLAGLSNGEMTRAQYARSLASQQQSKVGDQWSFFQAKRLRSTFIKNELGYLQATTELRPLDSAKLQSMILHDTPDNLSSVIPVLLGAKLPVPDSKPIAHSEVREALSVINGDTAESDALRLIRTLSPEVLEEEVQTARRNARDFDRIVTPVTQAVENIEARFSTNIVREPERFRPLWRDFTAARMRVDLARYDLEARYNRSIAELLELQVRVSNVTADRHHRKSQQLFAGMLIAQMAVILSTVSIAARQKPLVWIVSAILGLAAVGFGSYVYLFI